MVRYWRDLEVAYILQEHMASFCRIMARSCRIMARSYRILSVYEYKMLFLTVSKLGSVSLATIVLDILFSKFSTSWELAKCLYTDDVDRLRCSFMRSCVLMMVVPM